MPTGRYGKYLDIREKKVIMIFFFSLYGPCKLPVHGTKDVHHCLTVYKIIQWMICIALNTTFIYGPN